MGPQHHSILIVLTIIIQIRNNNDKKENLGHRVTHSAWLGDSEICTRRALARQGKRQLGNQAYDHDTGFTSKIPKEYLV